MFVEKIIKSKEKKITIYPVHTNRASDLGNPCIRYHVLNRTRWQEKKPHDVNLQMIFDMGNEIEQIVLRELADAQIKVVEQQRAFFWPEYQITGHVDGLILGDDSKTYPFDVKSSSPYVFDSINTIDDLKRGRYPYLRKYPVQLNLYLLMGNAEKGLFLFKNKVTGQYKEIWMSIDYDLGEETLQRAEAINAHVLAGTLPESFDCEDDRCPFEHICLPDRIGKEVEIVDSDELVELLQRFYTLKESASEYEKINKQISKIVEGREKILAGNYFITGKWIERKGFTVNDSKYWKKTIKEIDNI